MVCLDCHIQKKREVHPISEKLPLNLEEKWSSFRSKYKHDLSVSFPPFLVFVDFVHTQATARTDFSFSFRASQTVSVEKREVTKSMITPQKYQLPDAAYYHFVILSSKEDHRWDTTSWSLSKHTSVARQRHYGSIKSQETNHWGPTMSHFPEAESWICCCWRGLP